MGEVNGNDNIVVSGDNNTIIKKVLMQEKIISDKNSISNLIMKVVRINHEILKGHNPNSIYLAGFTDNHLDALEEGVMSGLECNHKQCLFIDMKDQPASYLYEKIVGSKVPRDQWAKRVDEKLYHSDQVLIIKTMSKSKIKHPEDTFRELIKTLDDAHFKNIHPKTDLVFIDYASFLEKHYEHIGTYLTTNLIGIPL